MSKDDTTKKEENNQVVGETKPSPLPPVETEKEIKKTAPNFLAPDINVETARRDVALQRLSVETEPEDLSTGSGQAEMKPKTPEEPVKEVKATETEIETEKEVIAEKKTEEAPSEPPQEKAPLEEKIKESPISHQEEPRQKESLDFARDKPIVATPAPAPAIARPVLSFLDKFKELRGRANKARTKKKQANLEKILKYAQEHNRIDNKDVRDLSGVKDERARQYLDYLEKQGKLTQFNKKGPGVFYMPTKNK